MAELLSVGLDVGTTSTQMVVSKLAVENKAGAFSVPEMEIAAREILYKSPVYFTPLMGQDLVNGAALRDIVEQEYEKAGIRRTDVDTGAIIITGETSRRENARAVLEALADLAGDFVVATAGPDLESVLAAKGAGAVEYSARTGKNVLHFDIGGGTSNIALIEDGKITATTCLNVGGRLVKIDRDRRMCYISPVLEGLFHGKNGAFADRAELEALAEKLAAVLEMAAGLREPDAWLDRLETKETATPVWALARNDTAKVISFSGGVADCIESERNWLEFGDIGPLLGQAIRKSRLCQGDYMLGAETIRATVIGAGAHSAQLSGSTVFHQKIDFPLKNLPVVEKTQDLARLDGPGVLAVRERAADYSAVQAMAAKIAGAVRQPVYVAAQQDMAKALGVQLALRLGTDAKILCIDRVRLGEGDYLDVGAPVGPAIPVVVKTLVMGK
ncbi:MAG: ethanolamine ammonia-lyase reactivating factor EutA [Oscillospiraceae bacterium]|nr:ethanolamine ammonia-lyase reactivating factor EutA [Oscillospiraceae bacterium]